MLMWSPNRNKVFKYEEMILEGNDHLKHHCKLTFILDSGVPTSFWVEENPFTISLSCLVLSLHKWDWRPEKYIYMLFKSFKRHLLSWNERETFSPFKGYHFP